VSKPLAAGAALREDDDSGAYELQRSGPASNSWGVPPRENTGNSIGRPSASWGVPPRENTSDSVGRPSASWGRPAFGNGEIPTVGPLEDYSGTPSAGSRSAPIDNSTSTSNTAELLPHEQRARELMLERAGQEQQRQRQRQVNIAAGPGPESNRAGRPLPRAEAERLTIARQAVERRKLLEQEPRKLDVMDGRGPTIRRHVLGERDSIYQDRPLPSIQTSFGRYKDPRNREWGHLRRRAPAADQDQPLSFAEARARREEEAKSGNYTSLSSRSVFNTMHKSGREQRPIPRIQDSRETSFEERTRDVLKTTFSFMREDRDSSYRRIDLSSASNEKSTTREHPYTAERPTTTRSQEDRYSSTQTSSDPLADATYKLISIDESPNITRQLKFEEEKRQDLNWENHQRKRQGKFAAEAPSRQVSYNDLPKGRGKDKARRRQQFTEEHEEDVQEAAVERAELRKQRKREKAAKKAAAPTRYFTGVHQRFKFSCRSQSQA
jgi:translation initiation factor IF-2